MSGTRSGGLEAAKTNKAKYGDDFYSRIGATGGRNGHTGGFAYGDNGKKFGRAGGYMSRRSRRIKRGERLRNDEYNELVPLAIRALGTLRLNLFLTKQTSKATLTHRRIDVCNTPNRGVSNIRQ